MNILKIWRPYLTQFQLRPKKDIILILVCLRAKINGTLCGNRKSVPPPRMCLRKPCRENPQIKKISMKTPIGTSQKAKNKEKEPSRKSWFLILRTLQRLPLLLQMPLMATIPLTLQMIERICSYSLEIFNLKTTTSSLTRNFLMTY